MLVVIEITCVLAGMTPLVGGYYLAGLSPVAIACLITGSFWLISLWRQWTWLASLGLFAFVGAGAAGVWLGMNPILVAFSMLGSLLAWDLAGFSRRLRGMAPEDDLRRIEKTHFVRLAGLGAIGMVLVLAGLGMNLRFSFGWAFLLTLAAILGILQLADRLRRGG